MHRIHWRHLCCWKMRATSRSTFSQLNSAFPRTISTTRPPILDELPLFFECGDQHVGSHVSSKWYKMPASHRASLFTHGAARSLYGCHILRTNLNDLWSNDEVEDIWGIMARRRVVAGSHSDLPIDLHRSCLSSRIHMRWTSTVKQLKLP